MRRLNSANYLEGADLDLAVEVKIAAMGLPTDLAIEEDTGLDLGLPFRQTPIYLTIPSVEKQRSAVYRAKLALSERYKELRTAMMSFRSDLAVHDLDHIPLPPLALETLSNAQTFDELGTIVIEQRERFSRLRKKFKQAREIWSADDVSPQERYQAKADIDNDMVRLSGKVRYVPTLMEPLGDIERFAEAAAPAIATGDLTKGGKLIGPVARLIYEAHFRFRARPLLSLISSFNHTTVGDVAASVKTLFDHDLTNDDVARALSYSKIADKYVPKLAKLPQSP